MAKEVNIDLDKAKLIDEVEIKVYECESGTCAIGVSSTCSGYRTNEILEEAIDHLKIKMFGKNNANIN